MIGLSSLYYVVLLKAAKVEKHYQEYVLTQVGLNTWRIFEDQDSELLVRESYVVTCTSKECQEYPYIGTRALHFLQEVV